MDEASNRTKRTSLVRWLWLGFVGLWILRLIIVDGLSTFDLVALPFVVGVAVAASFIARMPRPRRSFYATGLACVVLAAIFIGAAAASGGSIVLGAITWAGVSAMLLVWTIYYERTEPVA